MTSRPAAIDMDDSCELIIIMIIIILIITTDGGLF